MTDAKCASKISELQTQDREQHLFTSSLTSLSSHCTRSRCSHMHARFMRSPVFGGLFFFFLSFSPFERGDFLLDSRSRASRYAHLFVSLLLQRIQPLVYRVPKRSSWSLSLSLDHCRLNVCECGSRIDLLDRRAQNALLFPFQPKLTQLKQLTLGRDEESPRVAAVQLSPSFSIFLRFDFCPDLKPTRCAAECGMS